jgi:predicted ribosome quality control (RQC) complex YloA/Tae2 family protein
MRLRYSFIKLRKHIRTRRLTNVRQLGVDRIVDFEFAGIGEGTTYHIIAEFYASVIYIPVFSFITSIFMKFIS